MAEFRTAFEHMMSRRGGYLLKVLPRRRGGKVYAGIAREFHRDWVGWSLIDRGDTLNPALPGLVQDFYYSQYWATIGGDELNSQAVACLVFGHAVDDGAEAAVALAQRLLGIDETGVLDDSTVARLNEAQEDVFVFRYAEARAALPATFEAGAGSRRRDNPVAVWFTRAFAS